MALLLKCSCERRLIAASESATVEVWKPEQWKRTRTASQALSLTQLNGRAFPRKSQEVEITYGKISYNRVG
ncbi:MAG: hypothetical protein NVSMB44_35470 [Ktedonobacteraceae bacterium]